MNDRTLATRSASLVAVADAATMVAALIERVDWRANGLDPLIGHRLPALLRGAGLVQVEVEVHGRADAPGTYHRKHLLALIEAVRDEVI
jgi:hypothetical protein